MGLEGVGWRWRVEDGDGVVGCRVRGWRMYGGGGGWDMVIWKTASASGIKNLEKGVKVGDVGFVEVDGS